MQAIFVAIALAIVATLGNSQKLPEPGICGVSSIKPTDATRIVNGQPAIAHSRPYQLLLVGFFPNGTAKFYCGASLISSTHVLTAAHCVDGNEAKDIRIYPGIHEFTSNLLTTSAGIPAKQYFRHSSYSKTTLAYDIAVIRLQVPVEVDNIKVGLICIPPESAPVCAAGTPVVASGWGAFTSLKNVTGPTRPTELHQVGLQCVTRDSNADCKKLTTTLFLTDRTKLCAYAPWKGVCFGDSGGPLVRERTTASGQKYLEQVGIMSGTKDCSLTQPYPDVYADVRFFSAWILKQVQASP